MSVRVNGSGLLKLEEGSHHSKGRTVSGGVKGVLSWSLRQIRRTLSGAVLFQKDEWTNPPGADADAFLLARAGTGSVQTVTTLDGASASGLDHPRNVTMTTAGADDQFTFPVEVVVTGLLNGEEVVETLTMASAGDSPGTVAGSKIFDKVTQVELPAYSSGGTISIGFGSGLGTSKPPLAVGGVYLIVREVAAGALATDGTLNAYGLYTPSTAPNGSRDYAIYYETDLSKITGRLST